jgi:hypothetical protein
MNPSSFPLEDDIELFGASSGSDLPALPATDLFTESLILAQDERWRRA